jgi:hypothetical protein
MLVLGGPTTFRMQLEQEVSSESQQCRALPGVSGFIQRLGHLDSVTRFVT